MSNHKIYVFKENRSKLSLLNSRQIDSIKITVDGCEITDGIRCDFLHIADNIEMYIELKGQDLEHAIAQIVSTIDQLSADKVKRPKKVYIICTRVPLAAPEIQKHAIFFKKNFNAELIVKSSPYEDEY